VIPARDIDTTAVEDGGATRAARRKRPHALHRCATADAVLAELRTRDIDVVSLVAEFVKPSFDSGVLITGSIAWGVATELSDLDLLVLLPAADAFKGKRKREVSGSVIKYLPKVRPNKEEVSLFLSGIELDIFFLVNPEVDRFAASGAPKASLEADEHASDHPFLTRLATGWIVHGPDVVDRWRRYYDTSSLRIKWMAMEFTTAAKDLEDMRAGIGLAPGHVAALGVYSVTRLLRALLAYNDCYSISSKWLRRIDQLIGTADPDMRQVLITGRELLFPTLLAAPEEERVYVDRVHAYCGAVKTMLSRDDAMGDILASIIHDLDIIV
jgi:hypothetical protein